MPLTSKDAVCCVTTRRNSKDCRLYSLAFTRNLLPIYLEYVACLQKQDLEQVSLGDGEVKTFGDVRFEAKDKSAVTLLQQPCGPNMPPQELIVPAKYDKIVVCEPCRADLLLISTWNSYATLFLDYAGRGEKALRTLSGGSAKNALGGSFGDHYTFVQDGISKIPERWNMYK